MYHQLRRWGIALIALISLAGCGAAATPEEAARSSCGVPQRPVDYRALGRRELPEGTVVVATCRTLPDGQVPAMHILSIVLTKRGSMGWQAVAAGGTGMEQPPTPDTAITYSSSTTEIPSENVALGLLGGEILAPDVATVEVTFSDGDTMQESPDAQFYLFNYPKQKEPCRLVALDRAGQSLQVINIDPRLECPAP